MKKFIPLFFTLCLSLNSFARVDHNAYWGPEYGTRAPGLALVKPHREIAQEARKGCKVDTYAKIYRGFWPIGEIITMEQMDFKDGTGMLLVKFLGKPNHYVDENGEVELIKKILSEDNDANTLAVVGYQDEKGRVRRIQFSDYKKTHEGVEWIQDSNIYRFSKKLIHRTDDFVYQIDLIVAAWC